MRCQQFTFSEFVNSQLYPYFVVVHVAVHDLHSVPNSITMIDGNAMILLVSSNDISRDICTF